MAACGTLFPQKWWLRGARTFLLQFSLQQSLAVPVTLLAALCAMLLLAACFSRRLLPCSLSLGALSLLHFVLLLCLCQGSGGCVPCPPLWLAHTYLESRNPPSQPCQPSDTLAPTPTAGEAASVLLSTPQLHRVSPALVPQWCWALLGQWDTGFSQLLAGKVPLPTDPGAARAPPKFPSKWSLWTHTGLEELGTAQKRKGQKCQPAFASFRQAEHRLLVHSRGMYQTQTLFYYRWGKVSTNNQMSFPIFCVSLCDADRGTPNVSKQAVPICSRQAISKCISGTESIEK